MLDDLTRLVFNRIKEMGYHRSIKLVTNYRLPLIKLILDRHNHSMEV